jgi:DNA-binding NtrC family response regulator
MRGRLHERLGGSETLDADVRFVTTTHRNLEEMIARGQFREDLYYRINVISITAPPLRRSRQSTCSPRTNGRGTCDNCKTSSRTIAARILGISRRTLYYKLEEHGLTDGVES